MNAIHLLALLGEAMAEVAADHVLGEDDGSAVLH